MITFFSNPYFIGGAYFGEGSLRAWLDQLSCNGTEDDIGECGSRGWGVSQCGHSKDVSVICGTLKIITSNIWYTVVFDPMVYFVSFYSHAIFLPYPNFIIIIMNIIKPLSFWMK